ncbi:hypothetical protein BDV38DRAFT_258098 [Aspergillus pseudotamarii]|uniref:Uncharacterized protein n=1 Tax=Aspergillus pseudotamarii TaxID=132259 RepID=A0A5N6SHS8_ASPPS|nr:uncharacterized protein BDV38DRAFT_258098 [Aspergillus pseudotamarii]KAE8133457.1 hypothetical protein BDV38DRAFT_258098 [Aspergillus pseudotamarii]
MGYRRFLRFRAWVDYSRGVAYYWLAVLIDVGGRCTGLALLWGIWLVTRWPRGALILRSGVIIP